jgi:hypothetical protein
MNHTINNDCDILQTEEDNCNREVYNNEYTVTRCRGDDGEVIICSECGKLEPIEYMYRDKSSALCNECSYQDSLKLSLSLNYITCRCCWEMDEPSEELLLQYQVEKQNDLIEYAKTYKLTVKDTIEYQTHGRAGFREGHCNNWYENEYKTNNQKIDDIPILATIEAFKELRIYNQLDDSLIDLYKYFK